MEPKRSDKPGRRLGNESGQTTIFVLCSFFTFFLFFALVANVGQAVNRRVMLQMVADAGAFSGASAQATAMNTISYCNNFIYSSWKTTEIAMLYFTVQICGVDLAITYAYKAIEIAMTVMIEVTNRAGAVWVLLEAEAATQKNIDYFFPDGTVHTPLQSIPEMTGDPPGAGALVDTALHISNMMKAWPALSSLAVVRLQQKPDVTKFWVCYLPPWEVMERNDTFRQWYEKADENEVTRFYWWVYAEPVDALVLPRSRFPLFGFPQVPAMTAAALAKPVGGEIEPQSFFEDFWDLSGRAKYVAKMIPLKTIDAVFVDLTGGWPLPEVPH